MAASSQRHLRVNNQFVGRAENFRGRHLFSNIAKCSICGGQLHAVTRGNNLRLSYVCKANRESGACPNASAMPAAEAHERVIEALRAAYSPEKYEAALTARAADTSQVDARRAELEHLTGVVIPALAQQEERYLDAIGNGVALDAVRGRLKAITAEREAAEAKRMELETWVQDVRADRELVEELRAKWPTYAKAMAAWLMNVEAARQALAKALDGNPIWFMPAPETRQWLFQGIGLYEGILTGRIGGRGFGSAPDTAHVQADQLTVQPPLALQQAAARGMALWARFQGQEPLPSVDGKTDMTAMFRLRVSAWATGRARKMHPISGGSDAPLFKVAGDHSRPPMFLDNELADDAPKIHLVLEADEGRAAWKPAHPVNRRRARRLQNRVGDKRVERPDGIDVHHRDVGPVSAEPGEPRLHDAHDVPRLLTHRLGGCLSVAHDPLDADAALAHFARAGHDERGPWRRARDRIGERVERGLGRRADEGGDVRARDRVLAVDEQLPLGQQRAVAAVERIEALEAERRRASELDGAQRGARPALRAEVAVDERETVAPRDRRAERHVDHLVSGKRDHARRERRDAGQEAIVAAGHVASGRRGAHAHERSTSGRPSS